MVRQGQIYDVDLPEGVGSVQHGTRPVVLTSANRNNRTSTTVIVAVITSQIKRLRMAEHVRLPHLPGLPKESMVCCEQRFTVDKKPAQVLSRKTAVGNLGAVEKRTFV